MKLGLVCISEQLKSKDKKLAFKTMTRKRFNELTDLHGRDFAIKELTDRILNNIDITSKVIKHCESKGISHYRLTCAGFPLITDPTLNLSFDKLHNPSNVRLELNLLGKQIMNSNVSVGSHPDQFNVLASLNKEAVKKTIHELNFQSSIIDYMRLPNDLSVPVNIHVNASPVNKLAKINDQIAELGDRFYEGYKLCSDSVKNRLTIENEDKGFFSVQNILKFHRYLKRKYKVSVPICYDNLHDECNNTCGNDIETNMELCVKTWPKKIIPVFHWSQGIPDKPRSHRDYYSTNYFPPIASREIKWECEVKAKDYAICQLLSEYNSQNDSIII
jgi:UV DNA damage endonuclease